MKAEVSVRSGVVSDLARLMSLTAACAGAPQWTEAVWKQVLASAAGAGPRAVMIAERQGEMVGFGVVRVGNDEAEIESVAVDLAVRREGVGRRLCEEMLRWARERGAAEALLEVRVSNYGAVRLYESRGFEECGRRALYYQGPDEDAIVMRLRLPE